MANNKTKNSAASRNAQNLRTFASVQKRRKIHADNHGEIIGAKKWVTPPKSK